MAPGTLSFDPFEREMQLEDVLHSHWLLCPICSKVCDPFADNAFSKLCLDARKLRMLLRGADFDVDSFGDGGLGDLLH